MSDEKPTCGYCEHFHVDPRTYLGGECKVPLPDLIRKVCGPFYVALSRPACEECFKRKAKP